MTALLAIWKAIRNPWVLLAIACVIGIGGTGWYRMRWLGEVAARAKDLSNAQQAALQAQARDAAANAQIIVAYQDKIDKSKDQANARNVAIATAPNSSGCVASQPMRAFFDSVRADSDKAGTGESHPSR